MLFEEIQLLHNEEIPLIMKLNFLERVVNIVRTADVGWEFYFALLGQYISIIVKLIFVTL